MSDGRECWITIEEAGGEAVKAIRFSAIEACAVELIRGKVVLVTLYGGQTTIEMPGELGQNFINTFGAQMGLTSLQKIR